MFDVFLRKETERRNDIVQKLVQHARVAAAKCANPGICREKSSIE